MFWIVPSSTLPTPIDLSPCSTANNILLTYFSVRFHSPFPATFSSGDISYLFLSLGSACLGPYHRGQLTTFVQEVSITKRSIRSSLTGLRLNTSCLEVRNASGPKVLLVTKEPNELVKRASSLTTYRVSRASSTVHHQHRYDHSCRRSTLQSNCSALYVETDHDE